MPPSQACAPRCDRAPYTHSRPLCDPEWGSAPRGAPEALIQTLGTHGRARGGQEATGPAPHGPQFPHVPPQLGCTIMLLQPTCSCSEFDGSRMKQRSRGLGLGLRPSGPLLRASLLSFWPCRERVGEACSQAGSCRLGRAGEPGCRKERCSRSMEGRGFLFIPRPAPASGTGWLCQLPLACSSHK